MLLRIIIVGLFILCYLNSVGQVSEVDSLKRALETIKDGEEKVDILNALTEFYVNKQFDSSDYFNQQAITLAKEKKYSKGARIAGSYLVKIRNRQYNFAEADSVADRFIWQNLLAKDTFMLIELYNEKGNIKLSLYNSDSALYFLKQGLNYVYNNPDKEAQLNVNLFVAYQAQNKVTQAIDCLFRALKISEESGDKHLMAMIYSNLAMTYKHQYKYEVAIDYLNKGIKLSKEINKKDILTWLLITLGDCYLDLQEYEKAVQNYQEAIEIAVEINDLDKIFYYKNVLANYYLVHNQNDSTYQIATQLINEVENMNIETKNYPYYPYYHYYFNKAIISHKKGNINLAIQYSEKAYQTELYGIGSGLISKVAEQLSTFHKDIGNYKEAYEYYVIAETLADSVANEKNLAAIEIQKAEYEFEIEQAIQQKELEKTQTALRLRTILIAAALLILSLVTFIAFILRRNNQLKTKQNEILEDQVEKRTQELISASQELEIIKQKQALEEAKSRFFANVSHEFRTPLTLIQAPIEKVIKNKQVNIRDASMLEKALRNSKNLMRLVTDILDLGKLETEKVTLNETSQVLYLVVRRIIASFETYAQSKNISLKLEYKAHTDLQVEIDKDKFEKIINNYLSNALKFTPKNGSIVVTVEDLKSKLQISVSDTGQGIPTDELEAVFQRYYQVKLPNDNAPLGQVNHYAGGTGIGLALCKEYATLFEGKVWAESPNIYQGATFYFEFPKKEFFAPLSDHAAQAINESKNIATSILLQENKFRHGTETPTILIVEDNYDLRQFLQELLMENYNIITAENGQEALKKLETDSCQLIISDVMMPLMDGFELLEKLKSNDDYRHIPVMMLTARAEMKDKLKALRSGVDDYMLKPFSEEELTVRVKNLILNVQSRLDTITKEHGEVDQKESNSKLKSSNEDDEWLANLEKIVQKNISNVNYKSDDIAHELRASRPVVFRKIKKLTGLTLNQYIQEMRLQTARELIEKKEVYSVKEVSYSVGFRHINYFSQLFKERFGKRPSEYFSSTT